MSLPGKYIFISVAILILYPVFKDAITGKRLVYSPKHKLDLYLQWRPIQTLTFSVNGKYISKRFTKIDNSESIPGYFVTDTELGYQ